MRIWGTISAWLGETAGLLRERERLTQSEYVASLIRYHALSQAPHALTGDWAKFKGWESDKLDQGLLALVQNKEATKGSFLHHEIRRVIEEMIAEGLPISVDAVAHALPDSVAKTLIKMGKDADKPKKKKD